MNYKNKRRLLSQTNIRKQISKADFVFTGSISFLFFLCGIGATIAMGKLFQETVKPYWYQVSMLIIIVLIAVTIITILCWLGRKSEENNSEFKNVIDEIWRSFGLKIVDHQKSRDILSNWISKAEKSIIACTYYIPLSDMNKSSWDEEKTSKFSNSLINKIESSIKDRKCEIHRIYQFRDIKNDFSDLINDIKEDGRTIYDRVNGGRNPAQRTGLCFLPPKGGLRCAPSEKAR